MERNGLIIFGTICYKIATECYVEYIEVSTVIAPMYGVLAVEPFAQGHYERYVSMN